MMCTTAEDELSLLEHPELSQPPAGEDVLVLPGGLNTALEWRDRPWQPNKHQLSLI